jgi:enterochelin esterase-like enzyme
VTAGIPHVFRIYPGAHERRVWSTHAPAWLGLALAHMTPATGAADPPPGLNGFAPVAKGPDGGIVLRGRIPNSVVRWDRRPSAVYLPPAFQASGPRYPVIFLLHGFPGSPSGFYDSLRLAKVADGLIAAHRIRPFVAVMPVAGRTTGKRSDEEWAGRWETYLVRDVVPWANTHLPLSAADRAIAGLSAGAFGAIDIALRHPGLFGVAESWSGYFQPFRDGPLARAGAAELAAHNPTLLVRREAASLRRRQLRFYLATGFNHGGIFRRWTYEFARELKGLRLPYRVWAARQPDGGRYLRLQLPAALEFAFAA